MSHNPHRVYIISPDLSKPLPGFFAVKLAKSTHERGLRVMCTEGIWAVFLDAKLQAPRSHVWQQAFGDLWRNDFLCGRVITAAEYARICESRLNDAKDGHDLKKPIDLNHVSIRKF